MNFTLNGATYHSAPHPHFTTDQHEIWSTWNLACKRRPG